MPKDVHALVMATTTTAAYTMNKQTARMVMLNNERVPANDRRVDAKGRPCVGDGDDEGSIDNEQTDSPLTMLNG